MADIDLFDNWFRVADKDKDGAVSGAEAVEFFQRSKLPQATLFQVRLAAQLCKFAVTLASTVFAAH